MKLAVVVILVLSVVTLTNLCSAAYLYESGNIVSRRCQHHYGQQVSDTNINCAQGWYKNQCKVKVCYKDVGENCGSQWKPEQMLKYGKCATDLMCCHGVCTEYSKCGIPINVEDQSIDFRDFLLNVKRTSNAVGAIKRPSGQLDDEEY